MARKPRLVFAGAIYHVLSRGNYRKELFDDSSARLFEKTLLEAAAKCGWLLHAYVIKSNHYHLAVEIYAQLEPVSPPFAPMTR